MIAPGTVKARASTMRFTNSSEKGTPCVEVVFNILEGPDKGTNVVWRGWMTEKTRVRTAESLDACGFDGENDATVTKNEVYIVIEHEEYEGKMRPRVWWVNDMSRGPGSTPMDPAKAADVKADLRGLIQAKKAAASGTAPAASAAGNGSTAPKF